MTEDDLPAAAALMRSLSLEFILHEGSAEAAEFFTKENNEEGLRGFMRAGTRYYGAELDGKLVGFIAIRDRRHVFHMFVARHCHGQGIARQLWQRARADAIVEGNPGTFTVNASNYAVPVYESMGFARTAAMQCKNGIYFNPMQLGGNDNE